MTIIPEYLIKVLINEAFAYRRAIIIMFAGILSVATVFGMLWPKGYTVTTTILVDERNIIQPLMEGTASTTDVSDRARISREIIYGRKIMNQILNDAGWLEKPLTPTEQEKLIKKISKRISVANLGRNLIKIEYNDDDAERAYQTTKRLAELFIAEALSSKVEESQKAFNFIDKQVNEYHDKLTAAEDALKEFRSNNLDAQPGAEADIAVRLGTLQTRIEDGIRELREAEIKKASLQKQLSGEVEVVSVASRENQYRARIAELQSQLDTLLLTYHDTYPDVVRIRHQIEDLNQSIADERSRREQAKAAGKTVIDENIVNNPMYQQLRQELSQTMVKIDTLNARIGQDRKQMEGEVDRGKRVQGGTAQTQELTRDYQVNRQIYEELSHRREKARLSMNLDRENQGLTFKIQEPATRPLQPTGLRLMHFVLIGLFLGIALPCGLLYGKLQIDGRVRVPQLVAERHKLPVLGTVPHLWSPAETATARREIQWLAMLAGGTIVAVAVVCVLRITGVI
ncbi:MAG: hypothetical protein HY308_14825 [Gammaproteobacteria bacterium]|nr:hypothetical protein [Gammaproteobacteria bacterium]